MALASRDAVGGGNAPFFKPQDFVGALAVIFEPKKLQRDVPSSFGPRNQLTVQVSVFKNEPQLEEGRPTVSTVIVNSPKPIVDELVEGFEKDPNYAVIAVVKGYRSKKSGKDTFVLNQATPDYHAAAEAYFNGREAALKKAIDDAPGFDD